MPQRPSDDAASQHNHAATRSARVFRSGEFARPVVSARWARDGRLACDGSGLPDDGRWCMGGSGMDGWHGWAVPVAVPAGFVPHGWAAVPSYDNASDARLRLAELCLVPELRGPDAIRSSIRRRPGRTSARSIPIRKCRWHGARCRWNGMTAGGSSTSALITRATKSTCALRRMTRRTIDRRLS